MNIKLKAKRLKKIQQKNRLRLKKLRKYTQSVKEGIRNDVSNKK